MVEWLLALQYRILILIQKAPFSKAAGQNSCRKPFKPNARILHVATKYTFGLAFLQSGAEEGKPVNKTSLRIRLGAAAVVTAACLALWGAKPPSAHAGWVDRVRDVFQVPGEVDKLKEQYNEMKTGYDATVEQLEETRRRAEEAQKLTEEYRKTQEQLITDNAALAEQNRQLAATLEELKDSEEARARSAARVKRLIWTAVLLVGGYFGISRVARYVMRARVKR